MFVPKTSLFHSHNLAKKEHLPKMFGLFCWNVYKQTLNKKFEPLMVKLLQENPADLILLQEVKINKDKQHYLIPNYPYVCAPNLETKKNYYGVLNASDVKITEANAILSKIKEPFFKTHKSTLVNLYKLDNQKTLLVVNIHAINFRTNNHYSKELHELFDLLLEYKGPMIVAGDFNNWNRSRTILLQRLVVNLKLRAVALDIFHQKRIKSVFGYSIDNIFYRGLHLIEAKTINTGRFSDHTPLYAKFTSK
ncbi:MAG: endonuclease/exonuclease/phosphatase family protein [Arcobacteraceae bacterium]|nr:endonuclease/exonuclease/phosphatase family protein [Arcobacteraceae bacterium]